MEKIYALKKIFHYNVIFLVRVCENFLCKKKEYKCFLKTGRQKFLQKSKDFLFLLCDVSKMPVREKI